MLDFSVCLWYNSFCQVQGMTIMHEKREERIRKPSGKRRETAKVIFLVATLIALFAMVCFCLFFERNAHLTKRNYENLRKYLSYSQVVEVFDGLEGVQTAAWSDNQNVYVAYVFEEYGDTVTVIFENGVVYDFCESGVLRSLF